MYTGIRSYFKTWVSTLSKTWVSGYYFFNVHKSEEHKNHLFIYSFIWTSQPAFTCPNLTIETLEQGVKYVQS